METWKIALPPFRKFKEQRFLENAKVSQFIYQIGESDILRKSSKEISVSDINSKEMQKKFSYLKKCLRRYRKLTGYGRGIAAVQVGIPERLSVVYTPEKLLTIINPKITKYSKKLLKYSEGCMSVSPIIAPVIRPAWIEFHYYDEHSKKQFWNTKDNTELGKMMNRVFQHEIDHMNGIIDIDKALPQELFLDSDPNFYSTALFEEV